MTKPKLLERPFSKELHPLTNRTYRVATAAIEACWLLVDRCLQYRIPGALIFGESRLGKTYAIEYLRLLIHRERPEIPTFHVQAEHKSTRSEGAFFSSLLRAVRHPEPNIARNSSKRKALHDRLLAVAEAQKSTIVVFFCDEAQRYSLHEYEWLRDVHDELAQCGVRLTTFLFGQERLCEQRARFQESGDTQIVKRFMVETLRFRGVLSAVDAATCLKSYDEHEYPIGSNWSFTRYYYPYAFDAGLRLEKSAHLLWDAFALAHQQAALAGEVEIPMEYFSRAVEIILLEGFLHDAVDFVLTEQHWTAVVKHSGYVASEQAAERNARGLGH
ncbi:ATP-binding protein [Undibacterium umbellatum]|uniref:ATP-binding protein n=1 Tax=Undibacterium umbellatum TaxID=2762300 RepID=UPI002E36C28D|nr:ATP-binding protein [Undibacterium umbellatum]